MADNVKKIVLAYSGGLDTSVILPWLKERYPGCEVIAMAADLGQGADELDGIEAKALASGASKCIVMDLKREFAEDYCFKMLSAGAIYEHLYLMGTSIARPLIAKAQVEVARKEKADAVSHGATGKGNDQVRFELTYMALAPKLRIIAPWKDSSFELTSREAAIEYAKAHKVPIAQTKKKIYSRDRNLWHISHEGADLEDPANEPKDNLWVMSVPVSKAPARGEYVEVAFKRGRPVAVNGKAMAGDELVMALNEIGGRNAVGQTDLVENRLVGIKSRGAYETPGGTILYEAHRALECLTLDRETAHYKQLVALKYADMVYNGQWFCELREALDAFVASTQRNVTGTVRVKCLKGRATVAGVTSPKSLYSGKLASFTMGSEYTPSDATGFIKLFGLQMRGRGR
ncbi:MAG: Argininosuccinate synthase [Planctomycetes bacterium ADurb.Bin126]|nr:MAG: Argininosuccinate synthase [Planctomycetes bacterium ADurb.Bin126]HOD81316.1 argininosuccinate synthase [Phycisphaerae bacterium]HQL74566.1 argininosuccinate synthase [Phycisphaerae bacterium]